MSIENANKRLESATELQKKLRSCDCPTVKFHYEKDKLVIKGKVPSWAKKEIKEGLETYKDSPHQMIGVYLKKRGNFFVCMVVEEEGLDEWLENLHWCTDKYFVALRTDEAEPSRVNNSQIYYSASS